MENAIMKVQIFTAYKGKDTLMVSESDGFLNYKLFSRISKTPLALSNLQMSKALPDHTMDSDDLESDIRKCVESGVATVEEIINYK